MTPEELDECVGRVVLIVTMDNVFLGKFYKIGASNCEWEYGILYDKGREVSLLVANEIVSVKRTKSVSAICGFVDWDLKLKDKYLDCLEEFANFHNSNPMHLSLNYGIDSPAALIGYEHDCAPQKVAPTQDEHEGMIYNPYNNTWNWF